jgi:phosphoribosyl-dephospho-CoA transferase
MHWGPTGSAGFELASGLATLSAASDLDVVLRCRAPAPRVLLQRVGNRLRGLPTPVDAQLDLGSGAVALDELLSGTKHVLLRTPSGPTIVLAEQIWDCP